MLVWIQFNALLLDSWRTSIFRHTGEIFLKKEFNISWIHKFLFAAEFYIFTQHHQSSCCKAQTKSHKWCRASEKSCEGGVRFVAIVGNNKFIEHDRIATSTISFRVCSMVLHNSLFYVISRVLHSNNLLFS